MPWVFRGNVRADLYGAISVDSKGGRVYQNQLVEPHVSRLAAVSTFYLDAGSDNIFRFSDQVDAPAISSLIGKISSRFTGDFMSRLFPFGCRQAGAARSLRLQHRSERELSGNV
jgi:hypothetical protein